MNINLQKKCRKCHGFFPAKPMELEFFCDKEECQKYLTEYHCYTIRRKRNIDMDYFDIYDFDRPIIAYNGKFFGMYERVCRVCGEPLFNKDGKYSAHRRYCGNHSGYSLWIKYNWGEVSKRYAKKISKQNKKIISKQFIEKLQENHAYYKESSWKIKRDLKNLTICEECTKICYIKNEYRTPLNLRVVYIHHKIPVHKITMENIYLIWDYDNLKALCKECHNKQDHFLKKIKKDLYIKFKKITEFIGVD